MKNKKLWLITIAALLCSLTVSAHDFEVGGIYYDIISETDLTVEVTYDSNNFREYSGAVTIPSTVTYNGKTYRVTGIGSNAFNGCRSLTSITIPESVTSIGDYAFEYCEKLTSINIPEGVTSIEYHTFYQCSSLTSINIPEGVTSIGGQAFEGCRSLTAISIPQSVTSLENSAFWDCNGLTAITIAEGNTVYDSREGCNAIIVSNSNTLMIGCSTTVIPEGVTSIGNHAFSGCSGLTSINIPEGVTSIGYGAFEGCSGLTSINIPEGVTSIESSVFEGCSSLTSINIPEGVTSIGDRAFSGCSSLTSINIPEGVTSIESSVFYGCSSLASIIIPEGVTSIESSVFYGCSSLASIIIPEGVTSIGYEAFRNCSSLTSINIPEGVTSIESAVFYGCSSLASITIPESVTSIGSSVFDGTAWYSNLPDGVIYVGKLLYEYKGTMPENTNLEIKEGTAGIGGYAFSNCSNLTAITLPESITDIGYGAFDGCSSLTSITLPESVTNIRYYTFRNCSSLTAINIPEGVTSIGEKAFNGCSSLTSITIPESVTSIGSSAFEGCTGELIVNCNISSSSFKNSKFSKVTIGAKVTSIGNYAFANCTSLKDVVFEDGSETLSLGYNEYSSNYGYRPGKGLFYDCPLESVYLGRNLSYNNAPEYGYSPFYHKDRSPAISLGNSITAIPSRLFYKNESLPAVTIIPEGVTIIESYAFYDCNGLRVVVIPESVTSIGRYAFAGCSNINIVVCNADVSINDHDGLSSADRILKGEYIDGCIFSTQDGAYALAAYVGEDEELILPKTYKGQGYSIGDYAFHYCSNLTSVTIPDGITNIGYAAFSGTSLTSVEIPASVQSIARGVFCEYEKNDALLAATPLRTVVSRRHVPARMIDGVPAEEEEGKGLIFSNYTYIHAPLYIPEGTYWDYAYAIGWGDFVNIKEMATEANSLQSCKAYMIADAEGCNYTVYDVKKKSLKNVAYTHSLDEESEDYCWTVLKENGKTYLYSLGAKKFATITDNGAIALSDTPVSVTISDDAEGLNVNGSNFMFVLNKNIKADITVKTKYLVTFKIGDEVIAADSLEYGASIVAPEAPEKEGYTFNGWGEVPTTMPAEDMTISGFFTVNTYKVYYYVGEEVVYTEEVAYGEAIPEYVYKPTVERDEFLGWIGETYETMPAHDVTYTANIESGIGEVENSKLKIENSVIYDFCGRKIVVDDLRELQKGIYIINGRKVVVK